jgi:hypothetical protein
VALDREARNAMDNTADAADDIDSRPVWEDVERKLLLVVRFPELAS